jgi:alcohol dehydrogenase
MSGFDAPSRTRLVFGVGVLDRLGELVRELGETRVLVVTDAGLVAAGHVDRAESLLRQAGREVAVFAEVHANPTTDDVEACVAAARAHRAELFVGLGGGSAIDAAKGANVLLANGGAVADYRGHGKVPRPLLPLVAVPTTAGTGTEMQSFMLISDARSHAKLACGDPKIAPRIALLDPSLTRSQPRSVTATTAVDTLVHAVETAVTRTRHPLSLLYSHEAFRLVRRALPAVLSAPDDLESRGDMQLAAAFAGTAIELSMLGAAHAAANPLTRAFGIDHGKAVGLALPWVVRFNGAEPSARAAYAALARAAGLDTDDPVEAILAEVERLLALAKMPRKAGELGIAELPAAELAAEAATQWTARHNPREIGARDFERLYRAIT